MNPPPGLGPIMAPPGLSSPPPGLGAPPGLTQKPKEHQTPKYQRPQQPNQPVTLADLGIGLGDNSSDPSVQVQRQAPKQNHAAIETQETYSYLEPRMQDLIVTSEGHILDSLNDGMMALWDKNFKLLKSFKNLFDLSSGYIVVSLNENKLVVSSENTLTLIDLQTGTQHHLWDCNHKVHFIQVTNHSTPRLYLACNDQFCIFKVKSIKGSGAQEPTFNEEAINEVIKETDHLALVLAKKTKLAYCDSILYLDNGIIIGKYNQQGDVFSLDLASGETSELPSIQGDVILQWAAMGWNQVAMAKENCIMLVEFNDPYGKVTKVIKGIAEDTIQSMHLIGNLLAGVNNKGELRLWDFEQSKCVRQLQHSWMKSQSHYNLKAIQPDTLLVNSFDDKSLQIYKVEPDFTISLQANLKARVRTVEFCQLSPCGNYLLVTQECGTYRSGGELDFKTEIEVYSLGQDVPNCIHRKKTIDGTLSSSQVTFGYGNLKMKRKASISEEEKDQMEQINLQNEPCVQYIIQQQKGIIQGQIVQWFFARDRHVQKDLLLKSFDKCQIYSFDRIVFSYNYDNLIDVQQKNDGFNIFAPVQVPQKKQYQNYSGLIVYNTEQQLLLQVKFDSPFSAKVFDMPNQQNLYFLNSKGQIEGWNLSNQQLIQKADCRPSTITNIRFQNNMLFLLGQGEWIVRNDKLGLVCKRKTENTRVKRIQFLNEKTCVVLHGKRQLEVWDLVENKTTLHQVDFLLSDFFISQNNIIAVGDYVMMRL